MRSLKIVLAGMLGIGCASVKAQPYSCVDTSGHAAALRRYVVEIVTGNDARSVRARSLYQLPEAEAVSLITADAQCRYAVEAYHTASRPGAPAISRTSLVVIKVGADRWVVLDPNDRSAGSEFVTIRVFDASWQLLASWSS